MHLERLSLLNFRCYKALDFVPDTRFNVIYGLNGQGKTSILEAISLLGSLKSFRHAKNSEIIRLGELEGRVSGFLANDDIHYQMDVKLLPHRKSGTINGKTCRYLSEYVGQISSVSFSPSDLEIIRGSPENRRTWLDKISGIFFSDHWDGLNRYQKVLEQRNRELKALSDGKVNALPLDFDVWTQELIRLGSKVIHNRIHTVDNFVDKTQDYYRQISRSNEFINLNYISGIFEEVPSRQDRSYSLEQINQTFEKKLQSTLPKEKILGTTLAGPHRDDVEFFLSGNLLKAFGSQGEVRSLVLAMRLAEVWMYKESRNINPLLLIDDFSSELDSERRQFLLEYLQQSPSQVFLSTTETIALGKRFFIADGVLTEQS